MKFSQIVPGSRTLQNQGLLDDPTQASCSDEASLPLLKFGNYSGILLGRWLLEAARASGKEARDLGKLLPLPRNSLFLPDAALSPRSDVLPLKDWLALSYHYVVGKTRFKLSAFFCFLLWVVRTACRPEAGTKLERGTQNT